MFTRIGLPEILALLVVVLLIFGPSRIGKIAGELGQSIKNFRDGLGGKENEEKQQPPQPKE